MSRGFVFSKATRNLTLVMSVLSVLVGSAALADDKSPLLKDEKIQQLSDLKIPITSAEPLLVQTPTNPSDQGGKQGGIVTITGVKANPTDKGVEVILETSLGDQLQVSDRSTGNNFLADITGGQLRLLNGDAFTFKSEKPLTGITEITVTNIDANTVRVMVTGEKALPVVELFDDNTGLIFAVASTETATKPPAIPEVEEKPVVQQGDAIELVVTGEQDGYRVEEGTTGTRTDTPLDIESQVSTVIN